MFFKHIPFLFIRVKHGHTQKPRPLKSFAYRGNSGFLEFLFCLVQYWTCSAWENDDLIWQERCMDLWQSQNVGFSVWPRPYQKRKERSGFNGYVCLRCKRNGKKITKARLGLLEHLSFFKKVFNVFNSFFNVLKRFWRMCTCMLYKLALLLGFSLRLLLL